MLSRVNQEGKEVERKENGREMLFSVAEVVLEIVPLILEGSVEKSFDLK